jgi:ferredoxin--NADP+ reductase
MIAELLSGGHRGAILSAVCVRRHTDLAYLAAHREVQGRFSTYRYVPLTTREPENVDPSRPDYIGPQYLQDYVRTGRLTADLGSRLDPSRTHIYLCGNPAMIGLPSAAARGRTAPSADGMVALLTSLGFQLDRPQHPGHIHVEQYR